MKASAINAITQAVIDHGDGGKTHPRLYEIYTSLVKHLHAFVRDVNLTEPELQQSQPFYTTEFDFVLKPIEVAIAPNIENAATVA